MPKQTVFLSDLYKRKYSMEELANNIDYLPLYKVLVTQTLTADFIAKYIYGQEDCVEDSYITKEDILTYQSHIHLENLNTAISQRSK